MTAPNRNTLWAEALVEELAAAGVDGVCVSPGSRSTPLTVAFARHDDVRVFSHLDERASAYFALGRARRTGSVTPLVCTSGTAAANYHPAVLEADGGRVPMLLLTADRPPELRDSGANQTVDQEKLYGDAVRFYKDLPEPEDDARKLRSLRTTAARALAAAEGPNPGPVHLNLPFAKPLEPSRNPDDASAGGESNVAVDRSGRSGGKGSEGRESPSVDRTLGAPELDEEELRKLAGRLDVERGLIVAGPADPPGLDAEAVTALAHGTGFPVLADPLSGVRYGGHTRVAPVVGGYDGFATPDLADAWPDPEVVLRLGASPTSKSLRKYLAEIGARQFVVDPAGRWREAEFTATDLVVAEPSRLCGRLSRLVAGGGGAAEWRNRWEEADEVHFSTVDDADAFMEGDVLREVVDLAPDPSTVFVSNSMPVRDLDRFAGPETKSITALGNRGASGIDGITSTALGAGSATTDHLTLVTGDLAYYHDMNGLLALDRCDVDATIVVINNDGGGIFHKLPIERFDPPFTSQFKTPHGVDFESTGDLYDLEFARVDARPAADRDDARAALRERYEAAVAADGSHVVEVRTDAEASHRAREALKGAVASRVLEL